MKKKKGFNHSVERFERDENRRRPFSAFWDFCRDCFGEEQEVPLPGNEALLCPLPSYFLPEKTLSLIEAHYVMCHCED